MEETTPKPSRNKSGSEEVLDIIIKEPGISAQQLADQLSTSITAIYNRVAKLRNEFQIKSAGGAGGATRYYPIGYEPDPLDTAVPTTPLRVGDETVSIGILPHEILEQLKNKPKASQTKYAALLAYADRLQVGEAAIISQSSIAPASYSHRLRTHFKDTKKFSVTRQGEHIIIERTI